MRLGTYEQFLAQNGKVFELCFSELSRLQVRDKVLTDIHSNNKLCHKD